MPSLDRTKNNVESPERSLQQRCVEAFQRTFHQAQRPPLEQFLPSGSEASAVLVELAHRELEFRLARGEPARVEEYLARYPRLAEDTMAIVKLVATEYAVRRLREENLDIADILERFPAYRDPLSAYLADVNNRLPLLEGTVLLQESPASRQEELLSDLPGFKILSELGRGATGVVYKARQLSLPRLVALKMLHGTHPSEDVQYRRFRKEIETIALLQHENVVQIHDIGEHNGRPFFTMEYLDGDNLAKYCGRQPQSPRLAAEWVETLARAMHAVHAKGIIHRDLKPSNVLRTAAGCLKIVDFGLARREASDLTITGDVLGTPSYMAPEQAAGKVREIGPATDVYALGAILYELLTGRPPFGGLSVMEVVRQVQESDPLTPRSLEARTPRDLETICLKCLRKEPHRRYADAAELADDLQRFRNGEAIRARPPTRTERTVRWIRRHPVFVVAAAAFLFAALTIPLALLAHTQQLQEAFDREHRVRMQVEQAERTSRLHATEAHLARYVSDLHLAHKFFKAGDVFQLPSLLRPYREAEKHEDPRGFAWHLLQRHSQEMRPILTSHDGPLYLLAYSPDGRSLISGGGDPLNQTLQVRDLRTKTDRIRHSLVSVYPVESHNLSAYAPLGGLLAGQSKDGGVSLWDIASGQKRMHLPLGDERKHLALSPDGRWLAVSDRTQTALWNGSTGQLHKILPIRGQAQLAFSPDGQTLVAACRSNVSNALHWCDVATGTLREERKFSEGVWHTSFSPRGTYLLLVEGNFQGAIWSAEQRVPLRWSHQLGTTRSLAMAPDERTLATSDTEGRIFLWDVPSGRLRGKYHWQPHIITHLAFAPDGRTLAAAVAEGQVYELDAAVRHVPDTLQTMTPIESVLAWSPDGETVAGASWDGSVHLFDRRTRQARAVLHCPYQHVRCLAFSPDGRTLAGVCDYEKIVRFWDVATGKQRVAESMHPEPIHLIVYGPDGRLLSVQGKTIRILHGERGTALRSMEVEGNIHALAFLAKGQCLLATDLGVQAWDLAENGAAPRRRSSTTGFSSVVVHLAVSADGRQAATGESDGTFRLWKIGADGKLIPETGRLSRIKEDNPLTHLQFRSDGKALLVFRRSYGRLWELPGGHSQDMVHGFLSRGMLSPDGQTLATIGFDGILRLWDVANGRIRQPSGQTLNRVSSLVFAADGRTLLTAHRIPGLGIRSEKLWKSETASLRSSAESLRYWETATGRELPTDASEQETMAPPYVLAQSPGGKQLAAGSEDGSVRIWDKEEKRWTVRLFLSDAGESRARLGEIGRRLWTPTNPNFAQLAEVVSALAFSPDGCRLAMAGNRGSIGVWDTGTWKPLARWCGNSSGSPWLAFAPDGRAVAGSRSGQVCLWDAETGQVRRTFGAETDSPVLCGVFAPNRALLALGAKDGTICLWNPRLGDKKRLPKAHRDRVVSLAFTPDGKTLASGSWDQTVRLWHREAEREIAVLEGHKGRVHVVRFSPDGKTLASGGEREGDRGEVLLWR